MSGLQIRLAIGFHGEFVLGGIVNVRVCLWVTGRVIFRATGGLV